MGREENLSCKVIDELLALDRNMEAVFNEIGVMLSQALVVGGCAAYV
jgi:hypothetical protein